MSVILAIDPGTTHSGVVWMRDGKVEDSGIYPNEDVTCLRPGWGEGKIAIEMIASYGMPVGAEVFETCVWIGRFIEAYATAGYEARLIYRKDVKMHLCGTPKAKDANIRQALIDKLGPPGTKRAPGGTYGVKSHAWAALGVAVTAAET